MSMAERFLIDAAEHAVKHYGQEILINVAKAIMNLDKSPDPVGDSILMAKMTAAETATTEVLRLMLKKSVQRKAKR